MGSMGDGSHFVDDSVSPFLKLVSIDLRDMEDNNKVFYSEIIRDENRSTNNLFDLINIEPAVPLAIKDVTKSGSCNFIPKIDKTYIPKRRVRAKVKTVRDIRDRLESDTYAYLTNDLEKQHNYLLKQVIRGSSKNEKTINIAKKILRAESPIARSTWQILTNINPHNHRNNRQFVLWNGKFIQVNGSIGGKRKLICRYDLSTELKPKEKINVNNINFNKRKGLLRNSLAIKFKPGPLSKKKFLDDSHQKYNSETELVDLPRVGLDVQPRYGTALDPAITSFLNNFRKPDGTVSQKWAEFAVSVLGHTEKNNVMLNSSKSVTFDLSYKSNQRKILMRKYLDDTCIEKDENTNSIHKDLLKDEFAILPEIKNMMDRILDAVEISINQENFFTQETDLHEAVPCDANTNIDISVPSKEKTKKRYCELNRLAVTVITLPDSSKNEISQICHNLYCTLGCICDSIKRTFSLREHCGREECMFNCKCDFSKYTSIHSLDVNSFGWIPAIKGIEDNVNMKLAKEELKFHQTVIVRGEQNILLKSEKRNWKSSKKYDNFYKNMCLKTVNQRKAILSINSVKINCENIEPWCMVHNLYKCFCKGRFTASNYSSSPILNLPEEVRVKDTVMDIDSSIESVPTATVRKSLRSRMRGEEVCGDKSVAINSLVDNPNIVDDKPVKVYKSGGISIQKEKKTKQLTNEDYKMSSQKEKISKSLNNEDHKISRSITENANAIKEYEKKSVSETFDPYEFYYSDYNGICARVTAYEGRKYSDGHYKNTNQKIREMEKNDKKLQEKMLTILKAKSGTENILNAKEKKVLETTEILDTIIINTSTTDVASNQAKYIEPSQTHDPVKTVQDTTPDSSNDPNFKEFFYDIDGLRSSDLTNLNRKPLPNENRIVTWLESNYKTYKQYADKGLVNTSLEPPKPGRVALYSWDFILGRYKDKKNIFLVSKQKPYRIFMAVNKKISIFQTCMNINEIRLADLHKYPQTVKNLLTNATDLEDNFCILRGFFQCWELIGSVTKISKNDRNAMEINDETSAAEENLQYNHTELSTKPSAFTCSTKENASVPHEQSMPILKETNDKSDSLDEADSSKWFVMTVENDFHEIRFYRKGFFVKYDSILKAIDVARLSGKTVRLSSQKCVDGNTGPQFGVYAIPNTSEYCVFIGPYELRDSLGIETVKTILDVRRNQSTRGFWITTNKIDNLKVIDNPMSFMPLTKNDHKDVIPLETQVCGDSDAIKSLENPNLEIDKTPKTPVTFVKAYKKIKPIKICRSKDLYQLSSDGSIKKISLLNSSKIFTYRPALTQNISEAVAAGSSIDDISDNTAINVSRIPEENCEEDAMQIKITSVFSQKDETTAKTENKSERSMFILKPEEINRKLMKGELNPENDSTEFVIHNVFDENWNSEVMDIELQTCTVDKDVCVISDDDSDVL